MSEHTEQATVELTTEQAKRFNELADEIAPYGTAAPEDVVEYLLDYHDGELKESMILDSAGPRPTTEASGSGSGDVNGGGDASTSAESPANEGLTPEEKAEKFRRDDDGATEESVAELDSDELSARVGE